MQRVDLSTARQKVLADIQRYVAEVQSIVSVSPTTIEAGIQILIAMRRASYEDLNQIQHEYAALRAIEWLVASGLVPGAAIWEWNPRQTGDASEPDLRAVVGGAQVIAGEVTTSPDPIGQIDKHMASTLAKLSTMPGRKFYFVLSDAMAKRARTKIAKAAYTIEVVRLPLEDIAPANDASTTE